MAGIVTSGRDDVAFVWFGELDPSLRAWLDPGGAGRALQFRPAADLPGDPLAIAELLAFTAREDANASAVASAAASGVSVVAFEGSGAAQDFVGSAAEGGLVARGDVAAFADEIVQRLDRGRGLGAGKPPNTATAGMDANVFELLREADRSVLPVSVVMLLRRTDRDAGVRLAALLAQTRPLAEVVVLGDDLVPADRDGLMAVAERAGRTIRIVEEALDRLSLAQQLGRAAAIATREFAWIVPPGDVHPDLLGDLSRPLVDAGAVASVSLPAQIGPRSSVARGLRSAEDLMAEPDLDDAIAGTGAVLWRRRALLDALNTLAPADGESASAILRHVAAHSSRPVSVGPAGSGPAPTAAPGAAVQAGTPPASVTNPEARGRKATRAKGVIPGPSSERRQR